MNLTSMKKVFGMVAIAAVLSACVDSPEEPLARASEVWWRAPVTPIVGASKLQECRIAG